MSDRETQTHRERWHDDIAAYSLDALDERESELLEEHLGGCNACTEQLRWLTLAVDQIPAGVEQHAAPPALRSRLMDIVDAEADVPRPALAPAPARSKRRWLPSFEGFTMGPALAGFAVVLLVIAGVTGYELRNTSSSGGDSAQEFAAVAKEGTNARGVLTVSGDQGSLRVADLPATNGAHRAVYQAWIKDEQGSVHPSSVFVLSKDGTGVVSIPAGLSSADLVMVTREPKGGSELPTEDPFLAADVT